MIWLVPAAWIGALAIAAPIVIHLLARPRAIEQPFPTLRFLPGTTSPALRRRRIDRRLLLIVRCAMLVAAAAAAAGPFLITRARRAAWNDRLIRETASDTAVPLRTAVQRAVSNLDAAPPGRREILIRSTFPLGSIDDADVAAIPAAIGLTFERVGTLPATADLAAVPVLTAPGSAGAPRSIARRIALDGARTTVVDGASQPATLPIEIVAPDGGAATLEAVLAERVVDAPADRRVRLITAGAAATAAAIVAVRTAWIADAISGVVRDAALQDAMAHETRVLASMPAPWHVVAANADGKPVVAAAEDADARLLVVTATAADRLATAVVIRSLLDARANRSVSTGADVVAIGDAKLGAWSRPAGPAAEPRRDTIVDDDRRAIWVFVLALVGLEAWMRRNDR
jgi:hypothetical protein